MTEAEISTEAFSDDTFWNNLPAETRQIQTGNFFSETRDIVLAELNSRPAMVKDVGETALRFARAYRHR